MAEIIEDTERIDLEGVLKQGRLKIPKYQRSYSWREEQVEEYLNDLFDSFDHGNPWFLGILYTYPTKDPEGVTETMILDGQQRMTTTFILLKEMLLFYENIGDNDALRDEIKMEAVGSLQSILFRTMTKDPRLTLDTANKDKFAEYLEGKTHKEASIKYRAKSDTFAASHKLLAEAVEKIRARLARKLRDRDVKKDPLKFFQNLVRYVLYEIKLVEIRVASDSSIYTIFENINDRGLHLSSSDKFKNLLCSLLPSAAKIDQFEKEWFELSRTVHGLGMDLDSDFFEFYFRSIGEDDEGKFYRVLRDRIHKKSPENKLADTQAVFSGIVDMVKVAKLTKHYSLIDAYEANAKEELKRLSKVVSVLLAAAWKSSKQFRVLAYSAYINFEERDSEDEFRRFLKNLMNSIRFLVSATLAGHAGNAIRPFTIEIAKALTQGKSISETLKKNTELDFAAAFSLKNLDFMSVANNELSSLCLLLIQAAVNPEPIRSHDPDQNWSLEHFAPKKFEENWPSLKKNLRKVYDDYDSHFGTRFIDDDLTAKAVKKHRLQEFMGNKFYIDLGQNKIAQNKSFADKKKQYVQYGKPLTMPTFAPFRTFSEYSTFGMEEVVIRTIDMAKILIPALQNRDLPVMKLELKPKTAAGKKVKTIS